MPLYSFNIPLKINKAFFYVHERLVSFVHYTYLKHLSATFYFFKHWKSQQFLNSQISIASQERNFVLVKKRTRVLYVPRWRFGDPTKKFGWWLSFIGFQIFRFSQNGSRTLNGHQIQRFDARDMIFNILSFSYI